MKIKAIVAGATGLAVALGATAAFAAPQTGSSQMSFDIVAKVPVICRAQMIGTPSATTASTYRLGALSEFCNNAGGYRVIAEYSPSLANAKLMVDGKPVPLNKSGSAVVSQSSRAAIASRDVTLELAKGGAPDGQISFRIEPL